MNDRPKTLYNSIKHQIKIESRLAILKFASGHDRDF